MAFFPPFVAEIGDRPFICYTDQDMAQHYVGPITEDDSRREIAAFAYKWQQQQGLDFVPEDTDFMIGFLWTDTDSVYVDVWLNRQISTYGECGPMRTLQSFRLDGDFLDPWEKGNACDWTVIVCGREAEFRRKVMGSNASLSYYIQGRRPEMPDGFIIPWPDPDQIDPNLVGKGS